MNTNTYCLVCKLFELKLSLARIVLVDSTERISPEIGTVEQVKTTGFKITWTIDPSALVYSYQVRVKSGSDDWRTIARDIPRQGTFYEVNALTPG